MFYRFDWKALLTDSKQKKSKIYNNVFCFDFVKSEQKNYGTDVNFIKYSVEGM